MKFNEDPQPQFLNEAAHHLLNAVFASNQETIELVKKTLIYSQKAANYYSSQNKKEKAVQFFERGLRVFQIVPSSSLDFEGANQLKEDFLKGVETHISYKKKSAVIY